MLDWWRPQGSPDSEVSWRKNKQALALIELAPAHFPIFTSAQPNSCVVVEVATKPQRLWGGSTGAGHPSNSGVDSLWATRQTREESEECLENRQLKLNLDITVQQKKACLEEETCKCYKHNTYTAGKFCILGIFHAGWPFLIKQKACLEISTVFSSFSTLHCFYYLFTKILVINASRFWANLTGIRTRMCRMQVFRLYRNL